MIHMISPALTDIIGDQERGRLQDPYLDYHWQHTGRTPTVSPAQSGSMEGKSLNHAHHPLLVTREKDIEVCELCVLMETGKYELSSSTALTTAITNLVLLSDHASVYLVLRSYSML